VKTVVVGASSGLGRCIAGGLAARGAQIAILARRHDRLVEAAREMGHDTRPISCDVTDESSCHEAIEEAATALGGIDSLVYATGIGPLCRLKDLDAKTWRLTLDTNVVGAALITAAALPQLTAVNGVAAYLSSVSGSITPPWPGLGAYAVSKAALDKLVEAWRAEHENVGFTRIVVGDCSGGQGDSATQFTASWDPALTGELAPIWLQRQYFTGALLDVESLIRVVDTVLRSGAGSSISSVTVAARPPADHGSEQRLRR
jgi:NAD(P)-dependent dehydrogenase (short-subunit alcohol dehydrogenase family)